MRVGVSSVGILLEECTDALKPKHVSQIRFWGFARGAERGSYILPSGEVAPALQKLLAFLAREGIPFSLSPEGQMYLEAARQDTEELRVKKRLAEEYKAGAFDADEFRSFADFIRDHVKRPLKDHQLKAAYHLYLTKNGANFSVPGSGKTAVVLSVFEKLRHEGKVDTLFVVGPPACFAPWRKEFSATLGREPDWRILAGGDPSVRRAEYFVPPSRIADLYLTTFQTLLNDRADVLTLLERQGVSAFLVLDEAHYIKQEGGSWAEAALGIGHAAAYRCVLTGTPFPRSYSDIFNLFDFLWPQNPPLDSETKVIVQLSEERHDLATAKHILEGAIGPFFYRVRKADLGLMPPIFHSPTPIVMNKYERLVYDAIETRIREYAQHDYLRNIDLVRTLARGRMMRLRQCASYPKLLLGAVDDYRETLGEQASDLAEVISEYDSLETPAKLEHLLECVKGLRQAGEKVVIWANFVGVLHLIERHLTANGLFSKLIYGGVPAERTSVEDEETREAIRERFVDPKSGLDILIANPAACAESISLHKTCRHAIYYDLSYNCAQYLQSLDRIHRVGGSEGQQAHYHFLQYANTVDQDIKVNLDAKAHRMAEILDVDYTIYSLDMFEDDTDVEAYRRLFAAQ